MSRCYWLALAVLLSLSAPLAARDIVIEQAAATVDNDIIMLDIDAAFEFGEDVIAALESGIELFFDLDIRCVRGRKYVWNKTLFETSRRFSLERHALSNQFILTDVVTEERRIHRSLALAVADLGRIRRLPVIELGRRDIAEISLLAIRLRLDIGSLPAPMIPLAYISPGWHMSSGWFEWQVEI
ncbi:MAG TPA: DUF4390 domain-containing protein [Gammaproteobacteria bacterium]|nr:DUF4390 domain-containing protein [Gammaproteobacteria bacterium]